MVRILAGVLAAGILAAGLWWWAGTDDRVPVDVQRPGSTSPSGVASPAERLAAPGRAPAPEAASTEDEPSTRGSARRPEAARKPATPGDDDLLVRVVDRDERPVPGMHLVLIPGGPEHNEPQASAYTDRAGYGLFEGVRATATGAIEPWIVRHDVPAADPPTVVLTSSVLASTPIVSVQPWKGAVEVTVVELDGRPAPDGSRVQLTLVSEEEAHDPLLALERPAWEAELTGGKVLFAHVQPGLTWEAKVNRPDSDVFSRAAGPGPGGFADTAEIEVVLGSDHAIVAYRAVDEANVPIPNATLEVSHTKFFGFADERETVTDADGRFTVDLDKGWVFGQGSLVVKHTTAKKVVLQGRIEIEVRASSGLHEGGDVVLAENPLLARGRVEDLNGNPVAGAKVVAASGRFGDSPLDRGWARGSEQVEAQSLDDGRFELRGLLDTEEFFVQAERDGRRSKGVKTKEGAEDVVLVLEPRWNVKGRLVLDPGIDGGRLRLRLVEARGEEPREHGVASFPGDGTFAFEPVPPGDYHFECFLENERIAAHEDLRVYSDVDLGAIDLAGRIHAHQIVLRGAPEDVSGEIGWRPAGSKDAWLDASIEGPVVELLTPVSPVDLWVRPRGYRFVRLDDVAGRQEVDLLAPIRVRLDLVTDGVLPKFPYIFDPDLYQDGVHVGFPEGSEYYTDENRSVVFLVSAPGQVTVKWHLERRMENGAIGGQLLQQHEVTIDIQDVGGEQVFRIELDGAALTKLSTNPPW